MRVEIVVPSERGLDTSLADGEHTEVKQADTVLLRVTRVSRGHVRVELFPDERSSEDGVRNVRERVRFVT